MIDTSGVDIDVSCYHPIKAWINGTNSNGKLNLVFKEEYLKSFIGRDLELTSQIEIPCGQCIGCRLDYSRQWADRCMMELTDCDSAYFVTLTYDDDHLPVKYLADPETGEAKGDPIPTLVPKDLTDFWKNLRYHFPNDHIRYFACGEYGDHTYRPHYHAIIYGLHLDDLKYYKRTDLKNILYTSEKLLRVWSNGFVIVGSVTWDSCAYVARYVLKKAKGFSGKELKDVGFEQEFVRMSRRPGIGKQFLLRNQDAFEQFGSVFLATSDKSIRLKTPRYGKQLFEEDQDYVPADRFAQMMSKVESGLDRINNKLQFCDYDKEQLLLNEERDRIDRTKALRREL